ncbi:IS110 family transposase [Palleronia caenipelagi]|uniref:IS110 family transposase n=2 Tax=Palleronia caenipelagi TaxID=2489174 RepID=A0A547PM73_9RHOB|nr:IS110 family transposase [Palleronia caenipelagi]
MMNDLRELHVARLALVKERTAASNRASAAQNNVLKRQSKARLAFIERQLSELEEAITGLIAADPNLSARRDILTSIPGIGLVTAHMLLIEMPEQAASLAGLAPFTRRSGKWTAICNLHARIGRSQVQRRSQAQVPSLAGQGKTTKTRHHGSHAQTHPARQRPVA